MNTRDSGPPTRWALIPMKRFTDAKSRLGDHVSSDARAALAQRMFEQVAAAALQCASVDRVAVLTNGRDVAVRAAELGLHVLYDATLTAPSLGELIDAALRELHALGAKSAVVLMGDLPDIEAQDVALMADALTHAELALSRDIRGTCTNALSMRLPMRFDTAFGDPNSYAVHLRRAQSHGLQVEEVPSPRIAHDVDVFADLSAC
jgi:2-phospho-L-lactate guanylyltransferase